MIVPLWQNKCRLRLFVPLDDTITTIAKGLQVGHFGKEKVGVKFGMRMIRRSSFTDSE